MGTTSHKDAIDRRGLFLGVGGTMIKERLFGHVRETRAGSQARVLLVAAVLALPILGIGAGLVSAQNVTGTPTTPEACPPATPASGQTTPTDCVVIGEYDIFFKPNLVTIPADTPVRVVLINHGATLHNFSITDHGNSGLQNLNISVDTNPSQTSQTTITAPEGTYYFFCDVPGHEQAGMRGYITVKTDASITTSDAQSIPVRSS
jgi:nitrite reductase (NO-forming)